MLLEISLVFIKQFISSNLLHLILCMYKNVSVKIVFWLKKHRANGE